MFCMKVLLMIPNRRYRPIGVLKDLSVIEHLILSLLWPLPRNVPLCIPINARITSTLQMKYSLQVSSHHIPQPTNQPIAFKNKYH